MPSINQLMSPMYQTINRSGNAWTGYKPQLMTISPYEAQQRAMMTNIGQMGMQGLQTGQMPGGISFDPIRQQAITQFYTQTVPSLAERFTSMGGGQRSSAFQGALGQAGADLNENLAALQSHYQMQMLPMLMQMLGIGLQPQYEQHYLPGQKGFLESGAEQFLHGFGYALPGMMPGNTLGRLMSGVKRLFSEAPQDSTAFQGFGTQRQVPYQFGGGVSVGMPSSLVQYRGF